MSTLLMALLLVMVLPLFLGSWRASLFGLCCQGLLMAWLVLEGRPQLTSPDEWLTLIDFVLVRGLVAPFFLYQVLNAREATARNDVIPPNLLSWTAAGALVLVGFNFASAMVPEAGDERLMVAVATSGILLAFLVLSTQSGPFSQMVGALRFENALALFELGGASHHDESILVHAGQLVVFLLTIWLFRWYLETVGPAAPANVMSADDVPEGPTL
jgi:hydrogenase-4 membrane subunit HyfE